LAATARNQAAPLLEQLGTSPDDAVLLARIGDVYYDSQQYHDAQQYYERSLRLKPEDADVRADLGTCYWYQGDADTALAQYQKALSYQPHHAGALYNLGMVRWQGKMDSKGAVQAWETLLKVHPDYRDKDKVLDLIAKAKSGASN
jgi:tetratricopeptide (TPR) repeat protein